MGLVSSDNPAGMNRRRYLSRLSFGRFRLRESDLLRKGAEYRRFSSQCLQLTSSEFHRWIKSLQSGEKIMEAVELGKKSNLRSFGPYHQESIGGSFGLNGYDISYRNSPTSQNTYEFDRSILMEHDLVRDA